MSRLIPLLLVLAASLSAQDVINFRWWDAPAVIQQLNLTPQQIGQIRAIVREYRVPLIEQKAAVDKSLAELENELSADPVDNPRAAAAIERRARSLGELTRTYSTMFVKLRIVLNASQWEQVQRLRPVPNQNRRPN